MIAYVSWLCRCLQTRRRGGRAARRSWQEVRSEQGEYKLLIYTSSGKISFQRHIFLTLLDAAPEKWLLSPPSWHSGQNR